ncbi:electron transport complex subunit RsxC [Candidatus Woesearchaeota archaeon CG11_big_fil_rev_8_21_14_0_20_43_8]|nr:MAG: electron transport complex subunit RsxC [Candidatus Woesearchaeota archaeon CG11_big_fil_rev_8_21_14_0_20_43_8]PIO04878.1 MAG: electron transport complex subunit RsxC [Candidatus Woesearchaeota archaeon CG08_land_8_20_14_0_20_43_7]
MYKTFRGGIHPKECKITEKSAIVDHEIPKVVCIPLIQHIGAPCDPIVKVGDKVKFGQKIGDSKSVVSAPVHASISGIVKAIEPRSYHLGKKIMAVIIEGDGKKEPVWKEKKSKVDPDEIIKIIREAGIVGLGGAMFPTHVKLSLPKDKKIDTVILNGCECEPYVTADHRLMLEKTDEIISGMRLIIQTVGAEKGIVAIESNKKDAIMIFRERLKKEKNITVIGVKTKYPQGAEKNLINAVCKRIVPMGGLPMDVGVLVDNVATAFAVHEAILLGKPLIERICTVTGEVGNPGNYRVRIGTMFSDLYKASGQAAKVLAGGPMMGLAQRWDVPVIKGNNAVLVLGKDMIDTSGYSTCIKCGRCVEVCPMRLMPNVLSVLGEKERFQKMDSFHISNCVECGCCTYVCPANRPIVQFIKLGKQMIRKNAKPK